MKKFISYSFVLAAFLLISGAVFDAAAQKKVGGYKTISADDADARTAAEFAVQKQGEKQNAEIKLVSIQKAESQLVAGMNYRLCMEISTGEEGEETTQWIKAVVYRNLKKEFSLTSWKEEDCSE